MEGFCRSCLVKFDEPTDLIPYSEKTRRLFVYATGLQVKRNDTFTFQICKDCYLNMKVACNFKKTCKNSDKKFKNYVASKETGENTDFCTFLKNNDDSLKFRLPMYAANSTPANRNRDDDNESTCTSIQNFMSDILRPDEIPDSEARIIREVIEEEADILEDSLDSHWLQDDVSIDTDFRLDFSFSPFSTPRSTNDDVCYTPKKSNSPTKVEHKQIETLKKKENGVIENFDVVPVELETSKVEEFMGAKCVIDINLENALKNDSANKVMLDELLATPPDFETSREDDFMTMSDAKCAVDILENTLKNDPENKVMVDKRLATPSVLPNISAPATPLIKSILFGDKLESEIVTKRKNVYVPRKEIQEDEEEVDVLFEFFQGKDENENINDDYVDVCTDLLETDNCKVIIDNDFNNCKENKNINTVITEEPSSVAENKYCLKKLLCKICDKKFKKLVALKLHLIKSHKIKVKKPKTKRVRKQMICDYCGKIFTSSKCIVRHIQNHMNPDQYNCSHCPLSFRTKTGLKAHSVTHGVRYNSTDKKTSKMYVCNICGSALTTSSNYSTHMRRHSRTFTSTCRLCGRGFYRTSDLDVHMSRHTGERPFSCMYCPSTFVRQDALNRHIKCHTGEKQYSCSFCDSKFITAYLLRNHQTKNKACLEKQESILNLEPENGVTVQYAKVSGDLIKHNADFDSLDLMVGL